MIVDVHTHCLQPEHVSEKSRAADERAGYPPMQPLTPAAYLAGMVPVDRAIVFGIRALNHGVVTPNEFTADWVKQAPEKLIGFMGIDPTEEGYLEEIDRGLELGLKGNKDLPDAGSFQSRRSYDIPSLREGSAVGSAGPLAHGHAAESASDAQV